MIAEPEAEEAPPKEAAQGGAAGAPSGPEGPRSTAGAPSGPETLPTQFVESAEHQQ